MAKVHVPQLAFNAGEVSRSALARVDIEKLRLAAECQVNWIPSVIGAMALRPGTKYLGTTASDNAALLIPFVFGSTDTALIELTANTLRVWKSDALITRNSVSTAITNGDFSSATGWTLTASSGAAAAIGSVSDYPQVVARAAAGDSTARTSHVVPIPAEAAVGDLAIISMSVDFAGGSGAGTLTWPAGWTSLLDSVVNARHTIYYRTLDGTEGSSITVTGSGSRRSAYTVRIVRGFQGAPELASATGTSTTPDPASLTPSFGSQSTLWFAFMGQYQPSTVSALPTNYANSSIVSAGVTSSGLSVAICERSNTTATENPSTFTSSLNTAWVGATIGISPSRSALLLTANAQGSTAYGERSVSVAGADINVAHAATIVVTRGPVTFQVGSASGNDDYFSKATLETGTHSIGFTPGGDFYVRFSTDSPNQKVVDSIAIESAGTMSVATPWAAADLNYVRYAQSGDVIFVACDGLKPYRIERRDGDSWSVVEYKESGGPFGVRPDGVDHVTLTAGAQYGNTTLTASAALFDSGMVGQLVKVPNGDQNMVREIAAGTQWTEPVRVRGIGTDDDYSYTLSGTWVGTLTRQSSNDSAELGFTTQATNTVNGTTNVTTASTFDNVTFWVRWGFAAAADYTSGDVTVTVDYAGVDASFGIARITGVTSSTLANVEMVKNLKSTVVTSDWELGQWSLNDGYPSAVALYEGRLWWGKGDKINGSVSDDYTNFDASTEGDSGPIDRTIGSGPIDLINWLLPLQRLIIGTQGAEVSVRSSSQDEPLTPTNSMPKASTTQGSTSLPACKVDQHGVFVDKSGRRVYELNFSIEDGDYIAIDLTRLNLDIGLQGFVDIAAQRQPDTYIHMPRGDGQSAVLLRDPQDQVTAWTRMMTLGVIERVAVLPESIEDAVYFVVKRTINGSTKRFIEKMARRDQCQGGNLNYQADAFTLVSQASSTSITGLSYLEGQTVVVWANGKDLGSYTVLAGAITVSEAVTSAIVGLGGATASYSDTSTASASVTVGTAYNGYPCELFADRSDGGPLRYVGPVTVASGVATLPRGKTALNIIAYLGYYAPFVSAKLAYGAQMGTALNQPKKLDALGLIAENMHPQALDVGQTFAQLDDLPMCDYDNATSQTEVWEQYDAPITTAPGEWDTDSRLCLLGLAPRPVTLSGVVLAISTNE